MEVFQRRLEHRSKFSLDNFLNFTPLKPAEQKYLSTVYTLLAASIAVSFGGYYVSSRYFELPLLITVICQIGCSLYIGATSLQHRNGLADFKNQRGLKRLGAFGLMSYCFGGSLTSIIAYSNFLNPSIVPTALLVSLAVFASFSLAAVFAKQRSFLYLGSLLSSFLFYMSLVSIFNLFVRSNFADHLILYGGLALYVLYIAYDTQMILYEHQAGQTDIVLHGLMLYVDVVAVFIRILKILIEKEQREKRRRND